MPTSVLFYISGHGYGHARRMGEVISSLRRMCPDLQIHIRSAAPPHVFERLPAVSLQFSEVDAGLAEIDALTIDRAASLQKLRDFFARRESILRVEVDAVRRISPALIVADIPFLAGDIAAGAGVPCIGISNFTWDWIYENLFSNDPAYLPLAGSIAAGYGKMASILRLPFGRVCPAIPRIMEAPLVAMQSRRDGAAILAQLQLDANDQRPRVLFGTRGNLASDALAAAAEASPELLFLCPHEHGRRLPANARGFALTPELDFSDVMRISDVVISKLGYGMISECIATQTRLVWPPRVAFAEDGIVAAEAPRYVPMTRISRDDYLGGHWRESIQRVLALPPAPETMRTDGAHACAENLIEHLHEQARSVQRPHRA